MSDDPCTCNVPCPHGVLCSGGHANYPDSHWWPCCEQGCAGEMHTIHMLKLGGYIAVMAGCGHALVGEELGPLTRQGAAHLRECRDRDEQLRAAGRRQTADALAAIFEKKAAAYRRPPANWATARGWDVAATICEDYAAAAPAEPVEEAVAARTDDPRTAVLTWDWRAQPDLAELARVIHDLTGGEVGLRIVDTGSDDYAIVLSRDLLTDAAVHAVYERYMSRESTR